MVKIDVVSEAEAWAIVAKGKAGLRIIKAIEALKNLPDGKVLKVTLDNQTSMAWKTAFSRAAVALDMTLEMHVVAGGGVLVVRVKERGGVEPELLPAAEEPASNPMNRSKPVEPSYEGEDWRAVAESQQKPLTRVLVPHMWVKGKEYCNDLTQHTKHEEQENEGVTWCVWEGPEDRMPDVKGQVIDKQLGRASQR